MKSKFGSSTIDLGICNDFFSTEFDGSSVIVNDFLNKYQSLTNMFSQSLSLNHSVKTDTSILMNRLRELRDFLQNTGGLRCIEYLNEYEKSLSINDYVSCSRIETPMIEELTSFKETFVSMLA
jgi:hypothetical protein